MKKPVTDNFNMLAKCFYNLLLLSFVVSCGGKTMTVKSEPMAVKGDNITDQSQPQLIRLIRPSVDDIFQTDDYIRIRFEHQGRTVPDSVEVYFGGRLLNTIHGSDTEFAITPEYTRLPGIRPLKLLAWSGRERSQSLSVVVTLLSDIVPARHGYRVEKVFPHDADAYTQGLLFYDGYLYEGTGLEGKSTLRKTELETGRVVKQHSLENRFFGEGITIYGDRIYQLTWQTKTGFIFDRETFRELGKFYYNTEGWGLTTAGENMVMSDGTNKLYFVEPSNFAVIKTLEVYDNESLVTNLNELEFINGEIWANIYMTDLIARIDPETGKVTGYIDLAGIITDAERKDYGNDVLNGIAWDPAGNRIFVTGKNWPKLFQIRVPG
ncbi:MAG: glutaminyl-peptide cyclotransferase [Bacteroidales bacterium]|jgi:glutamine cyclotransferase|nr:glutaminyl-peptide cyclotransferase [Bacteroidales bacterium]